ncbi:MAG: Uncharacterised protein [Alphaproteobacteria bacterium]|nr:MAG: Uncharacterised protein [Alphaproteobacteria bacterium]
MRKVFVLGLSLVLSMPGTAIAQEAFEAEGTDFSNTETNVWVLDSANQLVQQSSVLSCYFSKLRPDVMSNYEYEALIESEACNPNAGNGQDDREGKDYDRAVVKSTLSTVFPPTQEITAWISGSQGGFDTQDIYHTIAKQNASTAPPFGEWYSSFYRSKYGALDMTPDTSGFFGFIDVTEDDAEDTSRMQSGLLVSNTPTDFYYITSVTEIDRANRGAAFIGVYADEANLGVVLTGKASPDYYFRADFSAPDVLDRDSYQLQGVGCYERDNPYNLVYTYTLFDEQGAEKELQGGFGFTYDDDGTEQRGYYGNWGVWFNSNYNFTPTNNSLDASSDGESGTLKWAAGKMYRMNQVTEALTDGTTFETWAGGQAVATWNGLSFDLVAEKDGVNLNYDEITGTDVSNDPWKGHMWSREKNASVYWGGGDSVTLNVRESVVTNTALLTAASTEFEATGDRGLACTTGNNDNLPVTYDNADNTSVFQASISANQKYFLTGAEPANGFEPRTLYCDKDNNGELNAGDLPVRYDFNVAGGNQYTTYDTSPATGTYDKSWPYQTVALVRTSDFGTGDCANDSKADCQEYQWSFGAYQWDQSTLAYNADESLYIVDEPIRFKYEFAAANDRNQSVGAYTFTAEADYANPRLCTGDAYEVDGVSYIDCSISTNSFVDKTFFLQYDGTNLHGLPSGSFVAGQYHFWANLINLKDGLQLTALDGTNYRIKAVQMSEVPKPANQNDYQACKDAGVYYDDAESLGLGPSDVPNPGDRANFPLPSATPASQPDDDNLLCTVTHGDTTSCEAAIAAQ